MPMKTFGERLELLIKKKQMNQPILAEKLGKKGRNVISNWVTGKAKPSADDLVLLAEILGTTTDYLLLGSEENNELDSLRRENELMRKTLNAYERAEKAEKEIAQYKNIEVVSND